MKKCWSKWSNTVQTALQGSARGSHSVVRKKTTKKTLHSGAPVSIFAKITVILSAVIFALSAQLLEAPVTFTFVALCAFRPTFLFRFWSVAKVCFLNAKLPSSDTECLERKNSQCPN